MNYTLKESYDWSKVKPASVKRGDMSMIAATVIKGGNLVMPQNRQRFVWPRGLEESGSRILTRRVWGQSR